MYISFLRFGPFGVTTISFNLYTLLITLLCLTNDLEECDANISSQPCLAFYILSETVLVGIKLSFD